MTHLPFSVNRNAQFYRNRRERAQAFAVVAEPSLLSQFIDWLLADVNIL